MVKTIIELCRELPGSEPELRERHKEFCIDVAEKCLGWHLVYVVAYSPSHFIGGHFQSRDDCAAKCQPDQFALALWANGSESTFGKNEFNWNPLSKIAHAKTATDAMIARGWQFDCGTVDYAIDDWSVALRRPRQGVDKPHKFDRECIVAEATTEPLARSAAALLAAEAMKVK